MSAGTCVRETWAKPREKVKTRRALPTTFDAITFRWVSRADRRYVRSVFFPVKRWLIFRDRFCLCSLTSRGGVDDRGKEGRSVTAVLTVRFRPLRRPEGCLPEVFRSFSRRTCMMRHSTTTRVWTRETLTIQNRFITVS